MRRPAQLIVAFFFTAVSISLVAGAQSPAGSNSPHVIEVTAKTFEFVPNEIHVKAGEHVRIKLSSADRAHGLTLSLYPEGASQEGTPGLVFEHPQDEAKVEKHKDRTIDFVAARPGTYDFKCSVPCSMFPKGHDSMTGKLIVDE